MNLEIFEYSILAAVVLILSACAGSFFRMGPKAISLTQHLTAGVVFAAVAIELLPKILKTHTPIRVAIGFSLGIALMVLIKTMTNRIEKTNQLSWGLLIGVGVDLFVDGLLIAAAFLSGEETGRLVALALILEVCFLSLSLSTEFTQRKTSRVFKWTTFSIFGLLLPLGASLGIVVLNYLPPIFYVEALSFGAAALLYLVTEELLVKAHETEDTPLITCAFFAGFLVVFILQDLS